MVFVTLPYPTLLELGRHSGTTSYTRRDVGPAIRQDLERAELVGWAPSFLLASGPSRADRI